MEKTIKRKSNGTFEKTLQIDELEAANYYENNQISVKNLSKKYQISSYTMGKILEKYSLPRYIARRKRHAPNDPWNKGKNKNDNSIIAEAANNLSLSKTNHSKKDGYSKQYSKDLKKTTKIHNQVWFDNTGVWPDSSKKEQIHHIDGDKNNNSFGNLLLTNVSEHSKIHKEYEQVFLKLNQMGFIKFNKDIRGIDWNSFNEMVNKLSKLM